MSTLTFCRLSIFITLLQLPFSQAFAQRTTTIFGRVLDQTTRVPLAYVNIGFRGKNLGTISDVNGYYKLQIPERLLSDTLFFSSVGYTERRFLVSEMKVQDGFEVGLTEEPLQLEDFVLSANTKRRYRDYGVLKKGAWGTYIKEFNEGAQIAQLIEAKRYPVYLASVKLRVQINDLDSLLIRVRILDQNKLNGEPGKDLFNKSIVKNIGNLRGWVEVDLEGYDLKMEKDFYVSVEFLNAAWVEGRHLIVNSHHPKREVYRQFVRLTSYGPWYPEYELMSYHVVFTVKATVFEYR